MKHFFLSLILIVSSKVISQEVKNGIKIEGIPEALEWVIEPDNFSVDGGTISITAGPDTDMFYAPHGNSKTSNVPKLLFTPDDDFVFSAKAFTEHKSRWEAATLVIYINEDYWAKFCFENESPTKNRMVSVVTNKISDDAYSDYVNGKSVYMKITKKGKQIVFSYSEDNTKWVDVRYFRLDSEAPIKIGFSSQSPHGKGLTSVFSEINYTKNKE
ncbi:DUF1349 domain-containing protein [Flavivirga algicola]|uniref:DUF1349 domain-containing protein n=1 Tax=Flavivirga algicola TaxID=2729136 RepID=A0ABX1RUR3_9FLAO|nr:DUF1349 domain-containing protein [Flavivirga algicola]NMH86750.1 DUF1349 domain-containing protein [Flavivirga algicola]